MGEKDQIAVYGTVPGTSIQIYQSEFPQPRTVLLIPWFIESKPTGSWTENRKRGEAPEPTESQSLSPWMQPTTATEKATRSTMATRRAMAREELLFEPTAGDRWGWVLRALGSEREEQVSEGDSTNTRQILTTLYERISPDQKTWLEPKLAMTDPYRSRFKNIRGEFIWLPWVEESCIPWLVFEGSKLGLRFAAPAKEYDGIPGPQKLVRLLALAIANPQNYQCQTGAVRTQGIRRSAQTIGMQDIQAISASAIDLYKAFALSLKNAKDKRRVLEAYHRILLYRFLKRRRLTPPAGRPTARAHDPVGSAIERRANLLQAHRLFVFNEKGCPVSINELVLKANGLDLESMGRRRVSFPELLPQMSKDDDVQKKWTEWLYAEVLEKPIIECRTIRGLSSLAGAGYLE